MRGAGTATAAGRAAVTVAADAGLWCLYQGVLGAPSRGFYPMVVLCFVAVPIAGAVWATRATSATRAARTARTARTARWQRPAAAAAVWLAVTLVQLTAFVVGYAALPYAFAVERVHAPAGCDGTYTTTARRVPVGDRTGILLLRDAAVTVVAVVDPRTHRSTVHVLRRSDGARLFSIRYPDDTVAVAVDRTSVVVFHDAIGTLVDKHTGAPAPVLFTVDSVGPNRREPAGTLGFKGGFDVTGYFSIWRTDGSVRLLEKFTFNGMQAGCFVDGRTRSVRKL